MKTRFLIATVITVMALGGTAIAAHQHRAGHGQKMHAGPMTLSEVEARVKEHFATVDANKDGVVEKAEADAAREKMRGAHRDARFKAIDTNRDGSISRSEFDSGHDQRVVAGKGGGHHKGMRGGRDGMGDGMMFARADANNDGRVTLAEALAKPTERFKMMDANNDGTVTREERKAAREKMRAAWRARRQS